VLRVLVIKDLRRWWSDRNAVIVTLALPLLLSAVLGVSFGGFSNNGPQLETIPLAIVGDVSPPFRDMLDEALAKTELFSTTWTDSTTADQLVRSGEARAALLIPDDLTNRLFSGEEIEFGLWKDPVSVFQADIVEQILTRLLLYVRGGEAAYYGAWPEDWFPAAEEPSAISDILEGDSILDVWRRISSDTPETKAAWKQMNRLMDHQVALSEAYKVPSIELHVTDREGTNVEVDKPPQASRNMFDFILPGMGVFFLMFAAVNSAADIHRERLGGTLQRVFVSPIKSHDFLLAKWAFGMINGLLQLSVLFAVGRLLFRLNLGPNVWVLPVVAVAVSAMLASLYLPMSLLAGNEKRMGSIGTGVTLFMGMVGGNFINTEAMPASLQAISHFVPNYWANRAITAVIGQNQGFTEVMLPLAILVGFAVFFLGFALVIFQRRGGKEGLL
jgi:ABC-2 type transport system permease protein